MEIIGIPLPILLVIVTLLGILSFAGLLMWLTLDLDRMRRILRDPYLRPVDELMKDRDET